ncbi:hypothetical protein AB205_0086630 [Aquarana catesbeiana]|uniref:PiggyBac transposable element-derived protein domain-containing protein n=1 Tax=Aquarana catesbeiana TaxID=8400 RepID=A0A2G9Q8H9_AQUCT|nr:hypothetical protein AB205_0086630 [Aquarana catesbeiana]
MTVQIPTATGVVEKPLCVYEYNLNMGGVDLNDQLLAPYLIARKVRCWYKKVSVYLFQLALLNAYVLYKASGRTGSFLKFQEEIITALLFPDRAVAQLPNPNAVSRLHERHFPHVLSGTPTQRNPQRRCHVCRKQIYRRDTCFYCPSCPDQPVYIKVQKKIKNTQKHKKKKKAKNCLMVLFLFSLLFSLMVAHYCLLYCSLSFVTVF